MDDNDDDLDMIVLVLFPPNYSIENGKIPTEKGKQGFNYNFHFLLRILQSLILLIFWVISITLTNSNMTTMMMVEIGRIYLRSIT